MTFKGHMRQNESDPRILMLTIFLDARNAMKLLEGVSPITQTLIPPRRLQRMALVECNRLCAFVNCKVFTRSFYGPPLYCLQANQTHCE